MASKYKLRPYQKKLVKDILATFTDNRSVVSQLDTAGGKSVVLSDVLRSVDGQNFVVAHRIELLEQIKEHLCRWMPAEQIAIVAGGSTFDLNASVFLVSVASFSSVADVLPTPTLIAIDECHHATADSYQQLFDRYPEAKILGLTATPERLDGTPLDTVFDALVCGPLTSELHEKGFTADYDYYAPEWRLKDKGCLVKNEFSGAKIAAANKASTVATEVFKAYKDLLHGKRTLIFAQTVEHSQEIAAEFTSQGLQCWHLDGETPIERRQLGMSLLRAGELDAITSVNLFDEGIDIPGLEGVLIARRTASIVKYLQMCGRIKRLSDEATIKRIVDCTDNWIQHGLPTFDREWSISQPVKFIGPGKMRRNVTTGEVERSQDDEDLDGFEVVYREVAKAKRVDKSQFRALYDQGLNDREIAKQFGCHSNVVHKWRKMYSLPSNQYRLDTSKFQDLYNQGLVDKEIADKCGCNVAAVREWRKMHSLPSYSRVNKKLFQDLYDQGLVDKEIADKCGCCLDVVHKWRKTHGLPSNQYLVDKSQFRTLYAQGLVDKEIADKFGCSKSVVSNWRKQNELPSNKLINTSQFRTLYDEGLNDTEIADKCGCSATGVRRWRKKHGLPSSLNIIDASQLQDLYNQGLKDTEIAKQCGCSEDTVRRWRKKHNLPLNSISKKTTRIKQIVLHTKQST